MNLGGGIGGLLALKQNGQNYHYLYDGKGNVSAVLDAAQQIVASYRYDTFGKVMAKSGTLDQPFQFSTKYYDQQTGLNYYGYRFYSSSLSRWINRDPLGEEGGINLYGFVGNNPTNGIDPFGLRNPFGNLFGTWHFRGIQISPFGSQASAATNALAGAVNTTASSLPPIAPNKWPLNGNIRPGSPGIEGQDWVCSSYAKPLNKSKCAKDCCIAHDLCYAIWGCNASSWFGYTSSPCQMCNMSAILCMNNNCGPSEEECYY